MTKINKLALIKTGDTTYDKIFAHFLDEKKYKLSSTQEKIKNRWLAAWTLRLSLSSTEQTINIYMERFGVSRAQAFKDINRAESLFGSLAKTNKDGKRAIWSEYVHQYLLICLEAGDRDNVGRALDKLERAWNLDKEDNPLVNLDKLDDRPIKLSIKKTVVEMVVSSLETGVVDFNNPITIDVDSLDDE